jgi:glucose-1-phosphate cytidylyltransferase
MKAVILAGGLGTRISEETVVRPKPMVEIGGKPILWHIMKMYSSYGVNEFIICCGYKGYMIKEYFANYFLHMSDITFDIAKNEMIVHQRYADPWKVTLVDTGEGTMTGGRLRRIRTYVEDEDCFCMTYGDGLSSIDIGDLVRFHRDHGLLATLSAVYPAARFGALNIGPSNIVQTFTEKPEGDGGLVNGGFFVLSPKIFDLIDGDDVVWEQSPLETLSKTQSLKAYIHKGFWQPLDTLRDKNLLEKMWATGTAPWKTWD